MGELALPVHDMPEADAACPPKGEVLKGDTWYLPGWTLSRYIEMVASHFPPLHEHLCFDDPRTSSLLDWLADAANEFDSDTSNGRGDSYRLAQKNLLVRETGIRRLFELAAGVDEVARIPRDWRALDLLGGDGLLARVLAIVAPHVGGGLIISDISGHMVAEALASGLPAVRQPAHQLFLRDGCVNAVITAYGTHHIDPELRPLACREAARVLEPSGRMVMHDFEEGSPVARWFEEVVHLYSNAGHPYQHFTAAEMTSCLRQAGLKSVRLHRVYDPLVTCADDPVSARHQLEDYCYHMYGLVRLAPSARQARGAVWKLLQRCFRYDSPGAHDWPRSWQRVPAVYHDGAHWVAEVPRLAMVCVGER